MIQDLGLEKRLSARQKSHHSYHNHARTCVKRCPNTFQCLTKTYYLIFSRLASVGQFFLFFQSKLSAIPLHPANFNTTSHPLFPITNERRSAFPIGISCVRLGKMQKKTSLLAFLAAVCILPTVGMAQQPLRWETSLENAQRLAGQTNRLVLIQFWAPWCGVCKRMEAEVLPQPSVVAQLAANYVPVKVNADHFPALARQYNVNALPTTIITTPQGQLLDSMRGRVEAAEFVARLDRIAAATKQRGAAVYAQMPPNTTPKAPAMPVSAQNQTVTGQPPTMAAAPENTNGPALGANGPSSVAGNQPNSPGMSDDRYADFFHRTQADPGSPIAQPSSSLQPPTNDMPPVNAPMQTASVNQPYPPSQAAMAPAGQSPVPAVVAAPYGSQSPPPSFQTPAGVAQGNPSTPAQPAGPSTQVPAIQSPLALDGFCPVTLAEKQQWVAGDRRWGAIHRGRTYLFSGPEEQRRFFSDPDRYSPAVSGNDIILATEQGQAVPGMREHGVFFGNRIYLFSSEATLERFAKNPNQYANQAMAAARPGAYTGTNPAVGR